MSLVWRELTQDEVKFGEVPIVFRCVDCKAEGGFHSAMCRDTSRYEVPSIQEPKAERAEVPPRETFALLPAAEVEELKSQLGEALSKVARLEQAERTARNTCNDNYAWAKRVEAELAQSRQREQEMRQELAEIGVKFDHDDEPYNESANKLARVVSEYQELQQEMRGKLKDIRAYVRDGLYHASLDAIEEVLAAIKEESNGK